MAASIQIRTAGNQPPAWNTAKEQSKGTQYQTRRGRGFLFPKTPNAHHVGAGDAAELPQVAQQRDGLQRLAQALRGGSAGNDRRRLTPSTPNQQPPALCTAGPTFEPPLVVMHRQLQATPCPARAPLTIRRPGQCCTPSSPQPHICRPPPACYPLKQASTQAGAPFRRPGCR